MRLQNPEPLGIARPPPDRHVPRLKGRGPQWTTEDHGNRHADAVREALVDEGLGVAFVEAGSLAEARSRLREGGLDAALIDVTMPDGNGLGLVGEIHDGGVGSPIPTLVLTASLDASVAVEALDAGARGALSKLAPVREATDAIRRLTDAGSSEE